MQENLELEPLNELDGERASLISAATYGIYRVSQMPELSNTVSEKINECNEAFDEKVAEAKETIEDLGEKIADGIKDFCHDVYENISEFFNGKENLIPEVNASQFPASTELNEGITEGREFGLDKCTEAALEIFTPAVIDDWSNLSVDDRLGIALTYAQKVAEAFEVDYKGVYIEHMVDCWGYNNGDGTIHLSDLLLNGFASPFQMMDTITHELRHQYQNECIRGLHNVSDEVINEWAVATEMYSYNEPSCYDPWGYAYNPLEIDSNYAGNTVVRNVTSEIFNNLDKLVNA